MESNEEVTESDYSNVCFTINSPLKVLPLHFWYFHCSTFKMTFYKNFMKTATLPFCNPFQNLRSGNRWQFNDYQKCTLNNSQNLQKMFLCLSSTYKLRYLIFAGSRISANCCFMVTNQSYIQVSHLQKFGRWKSVSVLFSIFIIPTLTWPWLIP